MRISINTEVINKQASHDERYASIAAAGFTAIDWTLFNSINVRKLDYEGKCIFEKSLDEVIAHYSEELAAIRKHGLAIAQAHAPTSPYIEGHPEVTEYLIRIYCRMIEFCDYVGCPKLIIHGIDHKLDNFSDTPAEIDRFNRHMYASLIPTLQQHNVTVCMENLYVRKYRTTNDDVFIEGPASDPTLTAELIDSLNCQAGKEVFGICLDTGHMHIVRKDVRTYVPMLGKRIKALHLNDNNCFADQHLVPFAGTADWEGICKALKDIGYDGDLNFEVDGHFRTLNAFGSDVISPWLKLICKIGECFRNRIQN